MNTSVPKAKIRVAVILLLGALLAGFPGQARSQGSLEPAGPPGPTMHSLEELYQQQTQAVGNLFFVTNVIEQIGALTNVAGQLVILTDVVGRLASLTNIAQDLSLTTNFIAQVGSLTNLSQDIVYLTNATTQLGYGMQAVWATVADLQIRLAGVSNQLAAVWAIVEQNNAMLHAITNQLANP